MPQRLATQRGWGHQIRSIGREGFIKGGGLDGEVGWAPAGGLWGDLNRGGRGGQVMF